MFSARRMMCKRLQNGPKLWRKKLLHVHHLIKLRPHSKALKRPLLAKISEKIAAEPIRGATSYHVTSRDNDMISENLEKSESNFWWSNGQIGIGHTYPKKSSSDLTGNNTQFLILKSESTEEMKKAVEENLSAELLYYLSGLWNLGER